MTTTDAGLRATVTPTSDGNIVLAVGETDLCGLVFDEAPGVVVWNGAGEVAHRISLDSLGIVLDTTCCNCHERVWSTGEGWSHREDDPSIVFCSDQDEPGNPSCRAEPLVRWHAARRPAQDSQPAGPRGADLLG